MAKKSLAVVFILALLAMLVQVLYLLFLNLAAAFYRYKKKELPAVTDSDFVLVIPAHDEEATLPATLEHFKALRTGPGKTLNPAQIIVVADNCTDRTAEIARHAGVRVYERFDPVQRGKGYAMQWTFAKLPQDYPAYRYCVIFDADTIVDPAFLQHASLAMTRGTQVMQGRYDVLKPEETWRTQLMYVAFVLFNHIRPLGRRVLKLSDGLKGNGMVFRREILEKYPWQAYSLVEDIEYGTRLVTAGVSVDYVPEARLYGQAAATGKQALSQRMRWEGGRGAQARQDIPKLVKAAIRQRSFRPIDRAMDLVIPPLGLLFSLTAFLGSLNATAWLLLGGAWLGWTTLLWAAPIGGIILFVVSGLIIARVPGRAYLALAFAPFYIMWKLWVYLILMSKRVPQEWVRTERSKIETSNINQVSPERN